MKRKGTIQPLFLLDLGRTEVDFRRKFNETKKMAVQNGNIFDFSISNLDGFL